MRKQRCMGVALLVVSAVIWLLASTGETVEERDGTALLLTFPLGIYLLVSKTYPEPLAKAFRAREKGNPTKKPQEAP